MTRPKMKVLACSAVFLLTAAACSDDDNQQNNNQTDATVSPDGSQQDGGQQDGDVTVVGCTGDPIEELQPMGACCNADDNCLDGACPGGWCSLVGCDEDAECDPTAAGPFPAGIPMRCNKPSFTGWAQYCVPGSMQDCGADGDPACPTGEICTLAWNDDAQSQAGDAFRGVCLQKVGGTGVGATGSVCDDNAEPYPYQCEAPSYLLGNCQGRRCSEGCDPANATGTCPTGMDCAGPIAFSTNVGVLSGGGLCGGQLCGSIQATGDPENDVQIPGIDAECPSGEVCVPSFFTGAQGDVYEFRCIPENTSYGSPGEDCEHAFKFHMFCNHAGLCLQGSADYDFAGATCVYDDDCGANEVCVDHSFLPSRCAAKPDPGFCTMGCRTDADCTSLGTAYCVDLLNTHPNGEDGFLTACYPAAELFDATPVPCTLESDCDATAGEGCLYISFHSDQFYCGTAVDQDSGGTDCSQNGVADCQAGEVCVEDEDAGTFVCSTISQMGDACDPESQTWECPSGWCFDHEFATDDGGTPTNTFCSGPCRTTADCGVNQVCQNVLFADNDPNVDTDDVVVGLCQTMVVTTGSGCGAAADCTGAGTGNACDTATGQCYTTGAAWGGACTEDYDCPQNGQCDTDAPGGLCYLPGCNPANGNADCGGGDTACSTENVVGICVEGCSTTPDCVRNGEGYTCVSGACVAP